METIKVYSPVEDKGFAKNLNNSPIWANCFHEEELTEAELKYSNFWIYEVKFDGLKPIQVTNIKKNK